MLNALSLIRSLFVVVVCWVISITSIAQIQPANNGIVGTPARDSNAAKSNNSKWKDEDTKISYQQLMSEKVLSPDTSLHTLHRAAYSQPWYHNLGNLGTPIQSMLFRVDGESAGPSLGYHVFDVYRAQLDSLKYFNTTRPYSVFAYQLGSKQEQLASILHTQNIKPNWNMAAHYDRLTSPGFYKVQRTTHDNADFTTHYNSKNQHYELFGAFVYNKEQQDENGGILADSFLKSSLYTDRKTIAVRLQNDAYSALRSPVTNMYRDAAVQLVHSYTFGHTDTIYNDDSTRFRLELTPRFSISHKLLMGTDKHEFKDKTPGNDSAYYAPLFQQSFQSSDSLYSVQEWQYIDNRVLLNSFLGKKENHTRFSVGAGLRYDKFSTSYITGSSKNEIVSNYVAGELKKEALQPGSWFYGGDGQFFLTGDAAGNFSLNAYLGKQIGSRGTQLLTGFQQLLRDAPYSYSIYQNQYYSQINALKAENITRAYATIHSARIHAVAGIRNNLYSNYIYINEALHITQESRTFSILQLWAQKAFVLGIFVLDNEITYQQSTVDAPVHIPALMGRHQLGIETYVFGHALKIATGIEVRYHTDYKADGYSPIFNRFYYQNSYTVSNAPEGSFFFNFKIKRFRAFFMVDQLNQLYGNNSIRAQGYAAPNTNIRFGFNWVMIN